MRQLTPDGWRNLLYLFVADEETMRPVMMKPFEQGGYVCASDTHVLIRVAKKYITDDYSTPAKAPDVSRIIPAQPPTSKICANELRKAFTILGMDYDTTTIDCIECDNDCEVEWKYTDRDGDQHSMWARCPCCNGTGRVPNGADKYCEIGSNLVCAYFMLLLYRAMINDQTMTESLVNLVLIFLAYLLIGKVEDIGYRKGYQDGVASKPPRVKIGFKTKQSKDDDTTSIH